MERNHHKGNITKQTKNHKGILGSSKNKKDLKHSSSKNIKTLRSVHSRGELGSEPRELGLTSPIHEPTNDYGVNPYFPKYKVKTSKKKEHTQMVTDYGTFQFSREGLAEQNDYAANAFQKLKLPNPRGLIDANGKFVSVNRHQNLPQHSFREQSTSKHSFSLNFTRETKRKKKLSKSKNKVRPQDNRSLEWRWRSADKGHLSYYEKVPKQQKIHKKSVKIKKIDDKPNTTLASSGMSPSMTPIKTQHMSIEVQSDTIKQLRLQVANEMQSSRGTIRKQRSTESGLRERLRCLNMLSRVCGILNMKRQTHSLAIHYLDQYLMQFTPSSTKLLALGALTLAIKMDDAEMVSKFCLNYVYSPERTVKRNSSNLRSKPKREEARDVRSKMGAALSVKISEEKKIVREDFSLEQVLDFETHLMVKLGFRLNTKTITYWIDLFTTLWDNFISINCPEHMDALQFRDEKRPRNLNYLTQLVEAQFYSTGVYSYSKVALILGALYLVSRIALQQRKQETPWQQLCRYYRASLAKSTNLIFCDGVGINPLLVDFLGLLELGISNIVDSVQLFSRYLHPEVIRVPDYRKIDGLTLEDRLATYIHNEELFKYQLTY